jgi:hypothetical protein
MSSFSYASNSTYYRVEIQAALRLLILRSTIISDKAVKMILKFDFDNLESATFCISSLAVRLGNSPGRVGFCLQPDPTRFEVGL